MKMLTELKSLYQMQTLLLCVRFCGLTLKSSYSYHLCMQGSRLWHKPKSNALIAVAGTVMRTQASK